MLVFFFYTGSSFVTLLWKRISNSGFELTDNFGSHDYYYIYLFYSLFAAGCVVVRYLVAWLSVEVMQPLCLVVTVIQRMAYTT